MNDEHNSWPTYLGTGILISILLTIGLVAAGSWNWFATFLESSAPAWVQAIGSVGAILGSVAIANWQHKRATEAEIAAASYLDKHRNDILYFTIERLRETCSYVAENIDQSKVPLELLRDMYLGGRAPLANFPVLEIRNPQLALEVMRINQFSPMAEQAFLRPDFKQTRRAPFDQIASHCADAQKNFWAEPPK